MTTNRKALDSPPEASGRHPAWGQALDFIGRSILGSDRPWDPANRLGLMVLCALLILVFGAAFQNFFTVENSFTILLNVTAIAIATFGSGMLIISGNIDLSIGGVYALVAVLTATVVRDTQSAFLGLLTAIGSGALLGFVNGRLIRILAINPLIVTLGMAAILRGFAFVASDARSIFGFPPEFVAIGRGTFGPVPWPVLIGGLVYLLGGYCLLHTVVGLRIYATGGNAISAQLAGIKTDQLVTNLYTINGALIGLVAALTVARLGSASPLIGTAFELDVLTAAILGGAAFTGGGGHPVGLLFGVVTIGVINAGIIFGGVQDFWQQIVKGSVLIFALAADQYSLRQRARTRPVDDMAEVPAQPGAHPTPANYQHEPKLDMPARGETVLACYDLSKSFGSVAAVRAASLSLVAGEIVCLVGDNGAGKSTLIKMLTGAIQPDAGRIEIRGKLVKLAGPHDARALGIETAYQDLALCPNLGAAYNLVLGAEPVKFQLGLLSIRDDKAAMEMAQSRMQALGIVVTDTERPVRLLSGGQRQSVAIARIASEQVSVAILDEPTAALGVRQTQQVLQLVRTIAKQGTGVLMISHNIDDVFAVADRVVVLRMGRIVHEGPLSELTHLSLIHLMAGLGGTPSTPAMSLTPGPK